MHLAPTALKVLSVSAVIAMASCATFAFAGTSPSPLQGSGPSLPASANPGIGLITVVDPATLPCQLSTTFEELAGGPSPGTNFDGAMFSGGVTFAERFAGQALGASGFFDVISGLPTGPLALQQGPPGQNLEVFDNPTHVLTGLGNLGYPDIDAIGEGAVAMLFPVPQSQVSFQVVGGNGGSATAQFYRADGSLIDTVTLNGLGDLGYGFVTTDGIPAISGILVQNTDPGGIGIDNVCHDPGFTKTRVVSWGNVKSAYR